MRRLTTATLLAAGLIVTGGTARAAEGTASPAQEWSFQGFFGTYDRAAQQRGFQVYNEVCAACHGLRLLSYRHLAGIGFDEEQIKAIAAEKTVLDGPNEAGEMFERPARPSDRILSPFPNDQAARAANNGALPPDLSLIAKARVGGPDYLHALQVGYVEPPADFALLDGMSYNAYFPGHQIAMPPPLSDGAVTYTDGTEATVDRMSRDVTTFLNWAAEPELEARKRIGVKTVLFLIVLAGLLYAAKRKVWATVH